MSHVTTDIAQRGGLYGIDKNDARYDDELFSRLGTAARFGERGLFLWLLG